MNKEIVNSLYVVDFGVDGSEVSFSQERKEEERLLAVAEFPICSSVGARRARKLIPFRILLIPRSTNTTSTAQV